MKRVKVVILCEDRIQYNFIRHFLLARFPKLTIHDFRQVLTPKGSGSGEQHVRVQYPQELKTFRSRHSRHWLLIALDADTGTVHEHIRELEQACKQANIKQRNDQEPVVFVIPKYSIETWLLHLSGSDIDENEDYKKPGRPFKTKEPASQLSDQCKRQDCRTDHLPDSLQITCRDFNRHIGGKL